MTRYVLPDLQYHYGALEPHVSGEIMELHHDRHHRGYVESANRAIERLIEARRHGDYGQISALERSIAYNVSGHVLHSIFWQNLSPEGGGEPGGELGAAIQRDFGSFEHFKIQMNRAAATIIGSGWAALVWEPMMRRLGTTQIRDHQSQVTQGGVPLMVIDAWEHAYYLQYLTQKQRYFEALWNLWNWEDVEMRFFLAQRLDLGLENVAETPSPDRAGERPDERGPGMHH